MYRSTQTDVRHQIVVLYSQRSRDAYAQQARERGETYTFTDAWGKPKCWLKSEYAYLSPNTASAVLSRYNLKHDFLEERELTSESIGGYRAIFVPNAGHLSQETIDLLTHWLEVTSGRLIVSGKTNLPASVLGLSSKEPSPVSGYTGWRWLPDSPFSDRQSWEEYYLTGYRGFEVNRLEAAPGSRVLAELVEFGGDLSSMASATKRPIGPAIVATDRTLYLANQLFELLGGVMQAHLRVEDVRRWSHPSHWGDTLAFFFRRMLIDLGLEPLWDTRLRSFGAYDGVFSFRQDLHGHQIFDFLEYEVQNLIPASFNIEDPEIALNTKPDQAREWVRRTAGFGFIEQALHNDAEVGDPPTAVFGTGLFDHVKSAEEHLGFPIYTCGRHAGGHMHPETLDAMDYLYAHNDRFLGLCTFSFYHMIEYGVRNPEVLVKGHSLTYATDPKPTVATPGFWFPYHAVVTTDQEWRPLRGWDRTHDYDCAYELVDTIFGGHNARVPAVDDQLENPVYSLQYHPQHARNPAQNDGSVPSATCATLSASPNAATSG